MATIDLDAYFRRTGYTGNRAPTLDTLRALTLRHTEVIPFENLDPLLRRPVRLDPASLEQKLVRDLRGGYCFEHNLLFRDILEALGYRVTGLAARVLWNAPDDAVRPRTHMLLRVEVNGETFITDVGFGGQTPTGPLRLVPGAEQDTPHEPFRFFPAGDQFVLQARHGGDWKPLYRFDLTEQHSVDYEVANWYVSTHPGSHFVTGLMAARPAPGRRYSLRNNELAIHALGGPTERRVLTDTAELRSALTDVFRLSLPDAPEVDAALARVAATPAPAA